MSWEVVLLFLFPLFTVKITAIENPVNEGRNMQLSLDTGNGNYRIRAYEPGNITINNDHYQSSMIVTPKQLVSDWPPQTIAELLTAHLQDLLIDKPEVILLGTGSQCVFPEQDVLAPIRTQQIGLEIMDTAAACRTFNVLMAEGRQVVAGLIIR